MNDDLLHAITKDLKINQYEEYLSKSEYRCAAIYSAAALWAKVSTQDVLEHSDIGSRRHVLSVCSNFLDNALDGETSEVKQYFDTEKQNTTPSIEIIDALIRTRELSECGTNADKLILSLPNDKTYQIESGIQRSLGAIGLGDDFLMMSGLSIIYEEDGGEEIEFIDNKKWVEDYLKSLSNQTPTRTKHSDHDHYFDIYEYGSRRFSRAEPHTDYPFEIVMNDTVGGEQYYLKTEKGYYQFSDLSSELREPYRFMIYLNNNKKNRTYRIEDKGSIFFIKGFHALPLYEDNLIRSVLWPARSVNDMACFFGPMNLKQYVLRILNSLNMVI